MSEFVTVCSQLRSLLYEIMVLQCMSEFLKDYMSGVDMSEKPVKKKKYRLRKGRVAAAAAVAAVLIAGIVAGIMAIVHKNGKTNNNDKCMEYENKIFLTDLKCFRLIKKLLKIEEPHQLVSYNLKDLQPKIRILRNHGISINQLSRITGLSKKIILSA